MGQSTAGTDLTTTAVATSRRVSCRFLVDWDDTGWAAAPAPTDAAGVWYDETAYVKAVRGELESTEWLSGPGAVGKGVSNVCYVTVRNPVETGATTGFKFSPTNTTGSLYAAIGDGKVFMKRAIVEMGLYSGVNAQRLRQIAGYIVGHQENYKNREVTFEIRDRACMAAFGRAATALFHEVKCSDYLSTVCDQLDHDAPTEVFDDGLIPLEWAWMDDETIWNEMQIVAESQLGRVWYDKDGNLHFDDGAHFVKPNANAWDDATTSQASFTTAAFEAANPRFNQQAIFNHIVVEYQPRYIATGQIIHTASEIIPVRPSSTVDYRAEYRMPIYAIPSTFKAVASVLYATTAGGRDISTSISADSTDYATYSLIEFTNAHTKYTAYICQYKVSGEPVLGQEPVKYEVEDATSIDQYGRRSLTVKTNPYITTYRHAQLIGDYMLARYKDPILTITLAGVPARPWLEPGDRVIATETNLGLGGNALVDSFFIGRISWSWSPKATYSMDLELMRCEDVFAELHTDTTPYFVIGTSVYGAGAGSGKLFW